MNMRALVIDDDERVAAMMTRCLRMFGWTAEAVHTAGSALMLFNPGSHDLIVCDIDLGKDDGIFLAQKLQGLDPSLRIVMTSGNPLNLIRARECGLALCIEKPFSPEQLRTVAEANPKETMHRQGELYRLAEEAEKPC